MMRTGKNSVMLSYLFDLMMIIMSFCVACGHQTETKIPLGDHKSRLSASIAAISIMKIESHLWCFSDLGQQRYYFAVDNEPTYGLWTLPAGYMELFETMEQGAARETREEAEAEVEIEQLYCMYNIPRIGAKSMSCSRHN